MFLLLTLILISVLLLGTALKIFVDFKKLRYVRDFSLYITLLEFHMEKAYDLIYKDQILIYSMEATKISDEQFNDCAKNFTKLVFSFLGPMLHGEYINLYGDEQTLIANIIEYFNTRYENDEIRDVSMDNLMEKDNV